MSEKSAKADRREAAPPQFIVWTRDYLDARKREVRQYVVVAGAPPPGFVYFVGTGKVDLMTRAGMTPAPITFDIPGAADVVQAFALWEAAYEAAIEKVNKRILPAGPGSVPPLPGPGSGRPGGRG